MSCGRHTETLRSTGMSLEVASFSTAVADGLFS